MARTNAKFKFQISKRGPHNFSEKIAENKSLCVWFQVKIAHVHPAQATQKKPVAGICASESRLPIAFFGQTLIQRFGTVISAAHLRAVCDSIFLLPAVQADTKMEDANMSNLQGLMQENRARILQFVLESFPFERTAFTIADFDGLPVIEQNLIWLLALTPFLDQPTETLRLLNGLGMETTPPFAKAIRFFLKEIVFEIRANLDRPLAKTPSEKNDSKNEFLARLAGVLADFEASMQSFERLPQARTGTDSINRIDSFIQSINTRPYKALHERIFFRIGQSCLVLPGLVLLSHFLFGTTPLRGGMALYLIAGGAAMALSPWLNHALTGMNNKGLVQAIQQGKALIFFDQKDLYDQVKEVFSALTIYHRQIQEMISQDPSLSLATDKIETLFSHSTVWALKCIRCLGPMKKNQIEEIAKVLEESKQEGQNLKNRIAALGDHLKSLRQRRGDLI